MKTKVEKVQENRGPRKIMQIQMFMHPHALAILGCHVHSPITQVHLRVSHKLGRRQMCTAGVTSTRMNWHMPKAQTQRRRLINGTVTTENLNFKSRSLLLQQSESVLNPVAAEISWKSTQLSSPQTSPPAHCWSESQSASE